MLRTSAATTLLLLAFSPAIVSAQTGDIALREAIQASVMNDPRVHEIPPNQLKELIDALLTEAKAQNMSAADILWRPQIAEAATQPGLENNVSEMPECTPGWQGYLCQLDHIFGFKGGNYEIPIIIIIVSGLLLVVLWEVIVHHRKKVLANTPPAWEGAPKQPPMPPMPPQAPLT